MLYLFYGNDREKAREKLNAVCAAFVACAPDAPICRVGAEEGSAANLQELAASRGLFSPAVTVVLEDVLVGKETQETALASLASFAESPNAFLLLEGELRAEIVSQVKKYTHTIETCVKKEEKKKPPFAVFSVADALGKNDRKMLWVLYQQSLQSGLSAEEIYPVLLWKIKTMLVAQGSESAEASGLSVFVFRSASADARRFTPQEMRSLSARLVALYHDARRGTVDMETGLEKVLLRL